MGKLSETFKNRFSAAISKWGTHEELAREAGVSRATMTRWLAEENVPDLDQVEAVARAMKLDPFALIAPSTVDIENGVEAAILAGRAISLERFQRMQAELIQENEALRTQLEQAQKATLEKDPNIRDLLALARTLTSADVRRLIASARLQFPATGKQHKPRA